MCVILTCASFIHSFTGSGSAKYRRLFLHIHLPWISNQSTHFYSFAKFLFNSWKFVLGNSTFLYKRYFVLEIRKKIINLGVYTDRKYYEYLRISANIASLYTPSHQHFYARVHLTNVNYNCLKISPSFVSWCWRYDGKVVKPNANFFFDCFVWMWAIDNVAHHIHTKITANRFWQWQLWFGFFKHSMKNFDDILAFLNHWNQWTRSYTYWIISSADCEALWAAC